jgi:hypothetical protein
MRAAAPLPDQPQHVIQHGNDRRAIFFAAEDYRLCLQGLGEAVGCNEVATT